MKETIMFEELLRQASEAFGFNVMDAVMIPGHRGGRNITFRIGEKYVLRVSKANDRTMADYEAETEFVHYLANNGASVADTVRSRNGNFAEIISEGDKTYVVCMFERAKGDQLADHGYRYIDGRPIEELWYNTGMTLGKIHSFSKRYKPVNRRFDFFEKYNEEYVDNLIPDDFVCSFLSEEPVGIQVKAKIRALLEKLRNMPADSEHYGMIHFDYSDGNYNIDYGDGTVTVYDFDNCRTGWYLFDLANLWAHGVGWIAWNDDAEERRAFMDRYFSAVCDGYRSCTELPEDFPETLPLMIDAVRLENIIDEFETEIAENGEIDCDGEQAYRIRGLLEDIPYMGFFDDRYDPENPFDMDYS